MTGDDALTQPLDRLRARLAEVTDLHAVAGLLSWDQQTMMPPRAGAARACQRATLQRLAHERFTDKGVGRLLDELAGEEARLDLESDDASLIRVARRDWDKARRVPTELRSELAYAGAAGQQAWEAARAAGDFAAFLPHLERNVELRRRYADCFPDAEHPYDALLDDYEEGLKTTKVAAVFAQLRDALRPLVAAIAGRADAVSDAPLHGRFPLDAQRALVLDVLGRLGFTLEAWRMDLAVHPFASAQSIQDIRLTNRYDESYLGSGLYGALHECGHGLYENGVDEALERTPLAGGVSLGVHESQSRLWENLVGRGRPFCRWLAPRLREAFPDQLGGLDAEALYRAANRVAPSLIRVEADEVTYSLHIILRFELERELIEGELAPRDLPDAWGARMRDYLGVDVPDDARGVLQDVHWSAGMIGYFPTYALGNVIAAQLFEAARADLPELDSELGEGDFAPLREWLRVHVHRHGRKFTPQETVRRAVGADIDVAPLRRYLWEKFGELYGVAEPAPAAG